MEVVVQIRNSKKERQGNHCIVIVGRAWSNE